MTVVMFSIRTHLQRAHPFTESTPDGGQMSELPTDPKKIKERITRYERLLRKEFQMFGSYDDGYGKRYLIGPLYMLVGDLAGAVESFKWFEKEFPDDCGEPAHSLCWTLALYRSGDTAGAKRKLLHTMLSNLYVIPHLIGIEQKRLDIWHGANDREKDYLQYMPAEFWGLWDAPALKWAKETYTSEEFLRIRARNIEIEGQLKLEQPGPLRTKLVNELYGLLDAPLG
jgi:hypothetical protein